MKKFTLPNLQNGQSTIELMVAIFIFTIAMAGIVVLMFGNQFISLDTEMNSDALAKAQALLEDQRALAKTNFNGIVAGVSTDGQFTKSVLVNDLNPCQKEVTSKIAWSTSGGAPKQVTLTTLITNLSEQMAVGGQCSGQNPINPALTCPNTTTIVGQQQLDTTQAIDTASATGVKAVGDKVYLSAVSANPLEKDLWILNVDPASFAISVDRTNSISTQSGGLNALEVVGNYAYGASVSGIMQLQIINISTNPPSVTTQLPLPGNTSAATAIAYRNNKIYIGTDISSGPEFFVVDVSNPLAPSVLGSYEVGGKVNQINLVGSAAYLATSNSSKQVVELNVTNPSNIIESNSYNPAGSNGALSVYFLGTKLFVGSSAGSNPNFNILNLATLSTLGSAYLPALDANTTGKAGNVVASGNMAFIGTGIGSDSRSKLMTVNVTNPAAPILCPGALRSFPNYSVVSMDFKGGYIYVALNNSLPLRIVRFNY
jgi:hypothetical protein